MTKSFIEKAVRPDPAGKLALTDEPNKSLDKPDPKIDETWINEAVARREAYLRGEARLIPIEEVFGLK